jgi:hypothetical protein
VAEMRGYLRWIFIAATVLLRPHARPLRSVTEMFGRDVARYSVAARSCVTKMRELSKSCFLKQCCGFARAPLVTL